MGPKPLILKLNYNFFTRFSCFFCFVFLNEWNKTKSIGYWDKKSHPNQLLGVWSFSCTKNRESFLPEKLSMNNLTNAFCLVKLKFFKMVTKILWNRLSKIEINWEILSKLSGVMEKPDLNTKATVCTIVCVHEKVASKEGSYLIKQCF